MNVDTTSPLPGRHPEPAPARGLRALVVEDNAADRWYFSEILRSRGYTVVSCQTATSGLEAFDADPTPLVMLDLGLPDMDGVEVCRRIRERDRDGTAVILAVTGADEPEVLNRILEAGADDFVRKPADPQMLELRLAIAEGTLRHRRARQETARALAVKTEEVETLFQNLHDVFFSVDLESQRLIQISPAAERVFGVSDEILMDAGGWKRFLLPPVDGHDSWTSIGGAVEGPIVREYELTLPDGTARWVRASVRVERPGGGRAGRADGVVSDITEERRARVELARRNEELAALFRIAEVSMASTSLDAAYEEILQEVATVLGLPMAVIEQLGPERDRLITVGSHGLGLAADESREVPVRGSLPGRAVQSRTPVVELDRRRLRELDGFEGHELTLCAAFPLVYAGRVGGALTVASDRPVSWSPRWTRLAANLAHSVAAFTERIEAAEALRENEAGYRQLAQELQEANQELESFAYSVSHDLRAPLRTMQGFAHALLQNFGAELPPEARDYARRIIGSGRQSEALIADLLAYSRLSFEEVDLKPVDLDSVVSAAVDQLQADVAEADADIRVDTPLPKVMGNHTTLVQVVANLLGNAIKFVPEGRRPVVRVRAEDEGSTVRLWVEDNGIGVPDDQEERIFKVFERLAEGSPRPGTGIGLAIVRRGLQRIGGSCGVERLDPGSAFWIRVPKTDRRPWRPWSGRNR